MLRLESTDLDQFQGLVTFDQLEWGKVGSSKQNPDSKKMSGWSFTNSRILVGTDHIRMGLFISCGVGMKENVLILHLAFRAGTREGF